MPRTPTKNSGAHSAPTRAARESRGGPAGATGVGATGAGAADAGGGYTLAAPGAAPAAAALQPGAAPPDSDASSVFTSPTRWYRHPGSFSSVRSTTSSSR